MTVLMHHRWTGEGPCPRCGKHRMASQHAGFDQGRRIANAFYADLDVDAPTRAHAVRNALLLAGIVAIVIITGLVTGPGSIV